MRGEREARERERDERDESEGTRPMEQCEYVFEERQERWMSGVNGF
jgi:hypothetical protein